MVDPMFDILMQSQSGDHLVGINFHYTMYIEPINKFKVSWAAISEQTREYTKYTIPQKFENSDNYKAYAKLEFNRTPFYNLKVFLN